MDKGLRKKQTATNNKYSSLEHDELTNDDIGKDDFGADDDGEEVIVLKRQPQVEMTNRNKKNNKTQNNKSE